MRILLIEDGELTRHVIAYNLIKLGHYVDFAINGEQGIKYAQKRYDLILLDIGLPDLEGYEVARTIRMTEKERNIIIAISKTACSHRFECRISGIDAVFNKPLNENDIQRILEEQVKHERKRQNNDERSRDYFGSMPSKSGVPS